MVAKPLCPLYKNIIKPLDRARYPELRYKDRLSRISFDMFQRLFAEFGCEIVVINDSDDKSDEAEIFEEIISLLHCFAMKMYSKRRKRKLEIVQEDLKNEISL